MARVRLGADALDIKVSIVDQLLGFEGSLHIPLAHVVNAYVSSYEDLDLEYRLEGLNLGVNKTVGIYGTPLGLILVDVTGDRDSLVLQLRDERYPRVAVQLPANEEPNALAHEIMRRVPDSGPVE